MIDLPHNFSKFISANRPPSLIIGAGVSYGLVPLPWELIRDKKNIVESSLAARYNCGPVPINLDNSDALYEWAEKLLDQLEKKESSKAKLILAQELGLTTDPRWMAKVDVELRGSTPRHRVMARFAKEGLWRSIWSLNWDTILESALECVGLIRGVGPDRQPWPTYYSTNLLNDDLAKHSPEHVIAVNKPHGCVQSLIEAEREFKDGNEKRGQALCERLIIGKNELSVVRDNPHDDLFLSEFQSDIGVAPLTAVGWSASEKSLRRAFSSVVTPRSNSAELEELTIVDPCFNDDGHKELVECYELTQQQVHFEVAGGESGFTVDQLFLWVQARYALKQMEGRITGLWKDKVNNQLDLLDEGQCPKLLIDFADSFLPAWVRMCWRTGILECPDFSPDELRLDRPDEHIPIHNKIETVRKELKAAAGLLSKLIEDDVDWDLAGLQGDLRGGLWDEETGHLAIPLPGWEEPHLFNDLRALGPLMRGIQQNIGFIRKLSILPLCDSPTGTVSAERIDLLKSAIARESRVPKFTDSNEWGAVDALMCNPGEAA